MSDYRSRGGGHGLVGVPEHCSAPNIYLSGENVTLGHF